MGKSFPALIEGQSGPSHGGTVKTDFDGLLLLQARQYRLHLIDLLLLAIDDIDAKFL